MVAPLLLAFACARPSDTGGPHRPPDTADTADTAQSFDSADTGDTADTPPGDPLCSERLADAPPAGPDCVTAAIACGDTVEATLSGGRSDWVGADYTHAFCFPNLDGNDYAGPERVYALELPADTVAAVHLDAPCADVDLAVLRWENADACPGPEDAASTCEGEDAVGDDDVSVSWDAPTRWLVVVDAKDSVDADTNFRVTVGCTPA